MKPSSLLLALTCLIMAGCQTTQPLYYWGRYESSLYDQYRNPGKTSLEVQAQRLEQDLTKAAAANLQPNPGLHAQLGITYLELGKADLARKHLEREKVLFPESSVFMDRILAKLNGGAKQ